MFAVLHDDVTSLHNIKRALAVPMKRFERSMLGFLTCPEMLAALGQPGESWSYSCLNLTFPNSPERGLRAAVQSNEVYPSPSASALSGPLPWDVG